MIDLPVYNQEGQEVDRVQIDEAQLGGMVRPTLLKQAIVMYHANQRQGTVVTKSRGMKTGSGHKLYRQKGTGRARMGNNRTVIRRGGGVAFGKKNRDFSQRMPKKQRRLARNSAVLAKLQSENTVVVDKLDFSEPKTQAAVKVLSNLKIERSCLVAVEDYNVNLYKSVRNIPRVEAMEVDQLNAGDVCRRQKLLFTLGALQSFLNADAGQTAETANEEATV